MRKPKPKGNHRHSADKCGVCAKPRRYKQRLLIREVVKEKLEEFI